MAKIAAPPRWILFLLWPFKGEPCYPQIEGDLCEEFQQQVEHGLSAARRWYYREICRSFCAMIWRWAMIPVIIIPFLCIAIDDSLRLAFLATFISWHLPFSIGICIDCLLNPVIIGLSLGAVCSRVLKGHERLIRLLFGVLQIGTLIITHVMGIGVFGPSPAMRFFLIGLIHFRFVWTLIFFWMGSVWIERRYYAGHNCA
jgi:hypothetical protein